MCDCGWNARILLVVCGPFRERVIQEHGDFQALITKALVFHGIQAHDIVFEVIALYDGTPLPTNWTEYTAIIFSGSRYNITERHHWAEASCEWFKRVVNVNRPTVPMLCICFGHQLVSYALGGEVDVNPRGPEWGTFAVLRVEDRAQAAAEDPLLQKTGLSGVQCFKVSAYHNQTVIRAPPHSVSFFSSDLDQHQLMRHAPLVYSTQFHPEFTPGLFRTYEPYLTFRDDAARHMLLSTLEDTPMAMGIVSGFFRIALEYTNCHFTYTVSDKSSELESGTEGTAKRVQEGSGRFPPNELRRNELVPK